MAGALPSSVTKRVRRMVFLPQHSNCSRSIQIHDRGAIERPIENLCVCVGWPSAAGHACTSGEHEHHGQTIAQRPPPEPYP